MSRKRGGYIPSEYDGRDLQWTHEQVLPNSARLFLPALYNQGNDVDCCTSMALATAFQIIDYRNGNSTRLSPLYHYYFARRNPQYLGVVTMRQALRTATVDGFCQLELHDKPITVVGALEAPSDEAKNDAKRRRLLAYDSNTGSPGYFQLDMNDRLARWKSTIALGFPVVAGIWTQSSYWSGEGMREDQAEPHQGAHAVCIIGYDDDNNSFTVRDSRGPAFANGGNWNLSYKVASKNRVIESWAIRTLTYDD